jgi:hypothetical protein
MVFVVLPSFASRKHAHTSVHAITSLQIDRQTIEMTPSFYLARTNPEKTKLPNKIIYTHGVVANT